MYKPTIRAFAIKMPWAQFCVIFELFRISNNHWVFVYKWVICTVHTSHTYIDLFDNCLSEYSLKLSCFVCIELFGVNDGWKTLYGARTIFHSMLLMCKKRSSLIQHRNPEITHNLFTVDEDARLCSRLHSAKVYTHTQVISIHALSAHITVCLAKAIIATLFQTYLIMVAWPTTRQKSMRLRKCI